jgi:Zn-dependent protease with chaperone function
VSSLPDRTRIRFPDISARAYEHPADRAALVALRKLSGFDTLLRKLFSLITERSLRLAVLASCVRLSEQQFPDVYNMVKDGAYTLDMATVPEVYVMQDPAVNAMAVGMDQPFIVITTGLINLMDPEELRAVIGHELGHIQSGHAVYTTMMFLLIALAARLSFFPIGAVGLGVIVIGLQEWSRKSELSGDRAGLLVSQDAAAVKRVTMKLAGGAYLGEMNPDAFREQARDYDASPELRDSILKLLSLLGNSHPYAVVRFAEIDRWASSGEYERILRGEYPRRSEDTSASVTEEVRNAAKSYQDSWSRSEDKLAGMFGRIFGGSGSGSGSDG